MELSTFLLTSGLYAGTYLLALWRVKRRMKKMNIRKFMDLEKKNEGGSGASPEMETDLSSAVDLLCNRVWRDPLYASDAYGKRDDSFGSTGFYDLSVL